MNAERSDRTTRGGKDVENVENADTPSRRDANVAYDPLAQPYSASTDPVARPATPPSVRLLRQITTQPYPFDDQPGETQNGRPAPVPQPEGLPKKGRDPVDGDSPIA